MKRSNTLLRCQCSNMPMPKNATKTQSLPLPLLFTATTTTTTVYRYKLCVLWIFFQVAEKLCLRKKSLFTRRTVELKQNDKLAIVPPTRISKKLTSVVCDF